MRAMDVHKKRTRVARGNIGLIFYSLDYKFHLKKRKENCFNGVGD